MAKRKKGGRRGFLSGLGRKAASIAGSIVQTIGAAHGLITGVSRNLGSPMQIPRDVLYDYSGVNIDDGSFNQGQAIKSATIIGVTFVIGKALKWVARH